MRVSQSLLRRIVRRTLLGIAAAALLAAPGRAESNDSAVGDSDFKITFQAGHGNVEGDGARGGTWYFEGAWTNPLGREFGFQLEGSIGNLDRRMMHGAGSHLFWRNPNWALLGGTFQYHNLGGNVLYRFGGEAELYLGRFTLTGTAGYQTGEPRNSASTCVGQGAFALSDLRFYPIDDLMLRIGGGIGPLRQGQYQGIMRFGGEYQPTFGAFRSASFFVNSDIGSRNHHAVLVGLRLYFGLDGSVNPQPLITRHRQYDPEFLTSTALQGFRDCAPVVIDRRPPPPPPTTP